MFSNAEIVLGIFIVLCIMVVQCMPSFSSSTEQAMIAACEKSGGVAKAERTLLSASISCIEKPKTEAAK